MTRRGQAALLCLTAAAGCGGGQEPSAAGDANLALGRSVSLTGGEGEPGLVTDGRIVPEAARPSPGEAVLLKDVRSAAVVDLGGVQPVGALLLQAEAADVVIRVAPPRSR